MAEPTSDEASPLTIVIPTWTIKGPDGGIKTVLTELVRALQDLDGIRLLLLCVPQNQHVFEPLCRPGRASIRVVKLPGPFSVRPITEQLYAHRIDATMGDVLLVPSNIGLFQARLPQIVISQGPLSLTSVRRQRDLPRAVTPVHQVYFRLLLGPTLRRADAVLAVTDFMRQHIFSSAPGIDPYRVTVVNEGVRAPDPLPAKTYDGPLRILFASSMYAYKGPELLIDALAEVHRRRPDLNWTCRFVGDDPSGGETEADLRRRIAASGTPESFDLAGAIPYTQIWQEYVNADVLAYPSRLESFGLPTLEAMACDTVVIAANIPALSEVVGDAGLLVDPLDASAFADTLIEVLASPARRQQLVEAGRQRAAEMTWEATAEGIVATARAVVAGRRPGNPPK
jgi:glycosyltransferase involved in cell wall biosynthesis